MELRLTDEVKEKLYGLMPFGQHGTKDFTPKAFKDESIPNEFRVIFKLRAMTKEECDKVNSMYRSKNEIDENIRDKIIMSCIKGWDNLIDMSNFEKISYKGSENGCDPEAFAKLSFALKMAAWGEINKISGLLDLDVVSLR